MKPLAANGAATLAILAAIGRITLFAAETFSHVFRRPFYLKEFGQQLLQVGYFSLPVVGLTTIFTGGALALQIYAGGARFKCRGRRAADRGHRHGSRTWPRACGPDDRGPCDIFDCR